MKNSSLPLAVALSSPDIGRSTTKQFWPEMLRCRSSRVIRDHSTWSEDWYICFKFSYNFILVSHCTLWNVQHLSLKTLCRWCRSQITVARFSKHGLTLISAWISFHIYYKVWDEINYPLLNSTVEPFGNGWIMPFHTLQSTWLLKPC